VIAINNNGIQSATMLFLYGRKSFLDQVETSLEASLKNTKQILSI
jgi:hypothetical protein